MKSLRLVLAFLVSVTAIAASAASKGTEAKAPKIKFSAKRGLPSRLA